MEEQKKDSSREKLQEVLVARRETASTSTDSVKERTNPMPTGVTKGVALTEEQIAEARKRVARPGAAVSIVCYSAESHRSGQIWLACPSDNLHIIDGTSRGLLSTPRRNEFSMVTTFIQSGSLFVWIDISYRFKILS